MNNVQKKVFVPNFIEAKRAKVASRVLSYAGKEPVRGDTYDWLTADTRNGQDH